MAAKKRNINLPSPRGAIDTVLNGRVHGWINMPDEQNINNFYLSIDGFEFGPFVAENSRPDLLAAGINFENCGFSVVIPVFYQDGSTHSLSLISAESKEIISCVKLIIPTNSSLKYLEETLVFSQKYTEHNSEPLVILAGYTSDNRLNAIQHKIISFYKKLGFYVVVSIASDVPASVPQFDCVDAIYVRRNNAYDFGSWALAYKYHYHNACNAPYIIFVNDSVLGPLNLDINNNLFTSQKFDVESFTDSLQGGYHLQSYYWQCRTLLALTGVLDEFLFMNRPLPLSKKEAIDNFELLTASFFQLKGYTVGSKLEFRNLQDLSIKLAEDNVKKYLNNVKDLFGELPTSGPIYDHVLLKVYNYYSILCSSNHLNPSHYFWEAVILMGFPFLKKEFLEKNPTNYPFPLKLREYIDDEIFELISILKKSDRLKVNMKL